MPAGTTQGLRGQPGGARSWATAPGDTASPPSIPDGRPEAGGLGRCGGRAPGQVIVQGEEKGPGCRGRAAGGGEPRGEARRGGFKEWRWEKVALLLPDWPPHARCPLACPQDARQRRHQVYQVLALRLQLHFLGKGAAGGQGGGAARDPLPTSSGAGGLRDLLQL